MILEIYDHQKTVLNNIRVENLGLVIPDLEHIFVLAMNQTRN
jgi:hypothetical protein